MSTTQDLLRKIEQLEKEKEEALREKEEAQREKEEAQREKEEAQREKEEALREKEEALRLSRDTTLVEYLTACHELVLSKVHLSTDGYLTTKVPTTSPAKKHCPLLLAPWGKDFVSTQEGMIKLIDSIFPPDERFFESVSFLQAMGSRISNKKVRDEASLVFVQNNAIEEPVRIILSKLNNFHPQRYNLVIPDDVNFNTTASNLRNPNDKRDTVQRDARLRTDQICVYRNSAHQQDIAYVIEYKAPHKLHTTHLEQGLREMNIFDEVVNKPTIPTADPDRFKHYAELLTAAATVQTYHYMLEAGLEYGYLTNGDAIVFLKIDWTDPTVLRYHLAQPLREVVADNDSAWSNAVCQVLVFTAIALQSGQHDNNERVAAAKKCEKWEVDFDYILDKITKEEEEREEREEREKRSNPTDPTTPGQTQKKHRRVPSSPDWQPAPVKKSRRNPRQQLESPPEISDRVLRPRKRRDGPGGGAGSSGSGSGSGGPSEAGGVSHGQGGSSGIAGWPSRAGSSGTSQQRERPRQYCTRACLLSLMNSRLLDSRCPNVALHRAGTCAVFEAAENLEKYGKHGRTQKTQRHLISPLQFMGLLRDQFREGLEPGVIVLGKEGACGALFQITLLKYGYTFVAKGVTGGRVPELEKEAAVYQKLRPLQGRGIPVYLGSVDLKPLKQVFFYDFDVRIIRFLLLSYGGTEVRAHGDGAKARVVSTVTSILDEMHSLGVAHGDIRQPNVLQGPDGEINVIDFDCAVFLPAATAAQSGQHTLSAISPNKRRRLTETDTVEEPVLAKQEEWLRHTTVQHDNGSAQSLFSLDCGRIIRQDTV